MHVMTIGYHGVRGGGEYQSLAHRIHRDVVSSGCEQWLRLLSEEDMDHGDALSVINSGSGPHVVHADDSRSLPPALDGHRPESNVQATVSLSCHTLLYQTAGRGCLTSQSSNIFAAFQFPLYLAASLALHSVPSAFSTSTQRPDPRSPKNLS